MLLMAYLNKSRKFTTYSINTNLIMEERKRQKQVGSLIQEELSTIFQRLGIHMISGAMISIASVKMTPDLLEARIYLSIYNAKDQDEIMERIREKQGEIKRQLGNRLRHQLRRIPVLAFYKDDTLDHVFKMEEVFKKIHEKGSGKKE